MRVRLRTHGPSNGARALANALQIKRLRRQGSAFRPRAGDVLVNWGSSAPADGPWRVINDPRRVSVASSKLRSLTALKEAGVCVPDFTTQAVVAQQWLADEKAVVGRQVDQGSSGRGIVYMTRPDEFQACPLYTLYVPKIDEYRVHVFDGRVIDVQQKRRRNGADWNNQIRTHSQGWIFARDGVDPPKTLTDMSVKATEALGLDFGAVDVGWTRRSQKATVYEVNTAPGLEGTTLNAYAEAIRNLVRRD